MIDTVADPDLEVRRRGWLVAYTAGFFSFCDVFWVFFIQNKGADARAFSPRSVTEISM